jgi:diguanylate cyclase (GGDEF)-like protein
MKILVADDDPTSRLIAQTAVQSLGHDCDTAVDGNEAWTAFRSGQPDVVITDWMMPGQTGLQLCEKIRAEPEGGHVYVILVTSHDGHAQILAGMSAGADDYLIKPLNPLELEARLIAATRVTSLHRRLVYQRAQMEGLNEELSRLARRDPLTGLRNRRVLQEDLAQLDDRVVRYGQRFCVAVLDIDHFKSYNDSYGHQAGDDVLTTVSGELDRQARAGDTLYRYGGEEFLCVLPEQTLAMGMGAIQRMRAGIQLLNIEHAVNRLGVVTVSAGVAVLGPDDKRSVVDVVKEADDALYQAKQLGRNRVESVGAVMPASTPGDAPHRRPLPPGATRRASTTNGGTQ